MRASYPIVVAVAMLALCAVAEADTITSFELVIASPSETYNFTTVRAPWVVNLDTSTVVFDAIGVPFEDVVGVHSRSNGNLLFTVGNDVFGLPGLGGAALAGDIIEWDGASASVFLTGASIFGAPRAGSIDALYELEDGTGRILFSTGATETIDGETFQHGDLILYDPAAPAGSKTSLFFDADLAFAGTINGKNIDAVHLLPNGNMVFSVFRSGASLGGVALEPHSLYVYDFVDPPTIFVDGNGLFDGMTRNLNAVSVQQGVPEPATLALVALGVLAVARRRRRA